MAEARRIYTKYEILSGLNGSGMRAALHAKISPDHITLDNIVTGRRDFHFKNSKVGIVEAIAFCMLEAARIAREM